MHQQENFDRIVATLHDAALDDTLWPSASALIDDAVGMVGSHLTILQEHAQDGAEFLFGDVYHHGEFIELGREYPTIYFPRDERFPRLFRLPDSQVFPLTDIFTEQEQRTSPTYNEGLPTVSARNGLNVRLGLDGPDGLHVIWALADPDDPLGWGSAQIALIQQLLPHIRQFVRVRQALAAAEALRPSLTHLLDNAMIGVLYLDRRGTIVEANARGRCILRHGDGLVDRGGVLHARFPTDNAKLQRLLGRALPQWGRAAVSGSMTMGLAPGRPPLTLHINPVSLRADFGAQRVAALVLLVNPEQPPHIDPVQVAALLGLTRAESQVAVALARGHSVRDIAVTTYRTQAAVRWHVRRVYAKLGISRQADLVRMVLTTAGVPTAARLTPLPSLGRVSL